jgi:transcriptional regulator with XRE-family HTH domain
MNLSLPSNICKLRKEHSMTQEQLAEALGVTFPVYLH